MDNIFGAIIECILWLIISVLLIWTGEILIFIFTAGRHKPRWDLYIRDDPFKFVILTELSFWVGLLFWGGFTTTTIKYLT